MTKNSKVTKIVSGLIGLATILSMFVGVTTASAQTVDIASLLAQIQQLQAQINAASNTGSCAYNFSTNLSLGSKGQEVWNLQKFLNLSADTKVAVSGAGSPGNETSTFGPLTRSAVLKFQAKHGISQVGVVGPITRAKLNMLCGGVVIPGQPPVVTGNSVVATLAANSPSAGVILEGQAIADLAHFTFQNTSATPAVITTLSFMRTGVSNDSSLSNIYLFNGANRITDAASVSIGKIVFNDSAGIFTVPAGGSYTVSVKADIAASTNGQLIGVQLTGATSNVAVVGNLPINGNLQSVASATIGTVAMTYTGPTGSSENPTDGVRVFEASTVVSTHAARINAITFENRGTTVDGDLRNFRLYVDGIQAGQTVASSVNKRIVFDLSSNPLRIETGTRIIKVLADVVSGSGETFDIQVRRAADLFITDAELGAAILVTDGGGSFPVSGSANTVAAATLSLAKASSSSSDNVALDGTNIKIGTYEVRAAGENVKISAITLTSAGTAGGLDNGKIFLNGTQIGSTKDILAAGTEFTFGSSFVARAGQTEILDIYSDVKKSDGSSFSAGNTVQVTVAVAAADTEGVGSGDSVTAISAVSSNSRTIAASTVTLTKFSGYGNQTLVAGTNNARLGAFTLSAGSTEGVNVNTITVTLSSDEAASITDLTLKDATSGATIGTAKSSPGTSNSYSVSFTIPVSGTKTINLYGNIKSGANIGSWIAAVNGNGTGATTATTVNFGDSTTGTLQTITIGSGTISAAVAAGNPVSSNVIAGATGVKVGEFTFNAASTAFTVKELRVKIPSGAATSVSGVTLRYKDANNVQQTVSAAVSLPTTQSYGTSTFTGLSFFVPQNDNAVIEVLVDIPTTANGATSGAAISAVIDADEGFKATDSSGTDDTSLSADLNSAATSGYGTMYVKKSFPTLAKITTGLTNAVTSGGARYKFTVSADAAGAIDWSKISFNVATTGVAAADWVLYDITSGNAVALNANATNTTSAGAFISVMTDAIQQVGAGQTKTYELRATTVTGWGDAADSISISLKADTVAIANAAFSTIEALAGTSDNFIWSDRSANSHSTDGLTATDWTNGFLVKDTTNSTYQCQFGTATTCN